MRGVVLILLGVALLALANRGGLQCLQQTLGCWSQTVR
jgi:hypothetical protein